MSESVAGSNTNPDYRFIQNPGILALLLALFCAGWMYIAIGYQVPVTTGLSSDYQSLAAAHAVNIDFWLESGRPRIVGGFQILHPGLPFQGLSWVAYRLAYADIGGGAAGRWAAFIGEPDRFVTAGLILSFLITAGGVALCYVVGRAASLAVAIATSVMMFAHPCNLMFYQADLGITRSPITGGFMLGLTNETTALPLAIAGALVMERTFAGGPRRWLWAALMGAVSAVAYLNKLNYISWFLAAIGVYALLFVLIPARRGEMARLAASTCLAFLVTAWALCAWLLPPSGLVGVVSEHFRIFAHTGPYGSGDSGIVSPHLVIDGLVELISPALRTDTAVIVLSLVAALVVLVRASRDGLAELAPVMFLSLSVVLGLAAVLKHFGPHYVIPCLAQAAMLLAFACRGLPPLLRTALAVIVIGLVVAKTPSDVHDARGNAVLEAMEYAVGIKAVEQLPINANEVRLWGYQTRSLIASLSASVGESGLDQVQEPVRAAYPDDRYIGIVNEQAMGDDDMAQVPWRYAVFSRVFGAPKAFVKRDRVVFENDQLIVFENSHRSPGDHS